MTTDLFLILNKEVSSGTLTPEQSEKIGKRYLEIQAMRDFTDNEKSCIFRAFVQKVVWPDGDPEIKNTKELDEHLRTMQTESRIWQEASRKDIVENIKKIEGQQVLFS